MNAVGDKSVCVIRFRIGGSDGLGQVAIVGVGDTVGKKEISWFFFTTTLINT